MSHFLSRAIHNSDRTSAFLATSSVVVSVVVVLATGVAIFLAH
jgi:hypothetical protein